jgi:hypothetical protein
MSTVCCFFSTQTINNIGSFFRNYFFRHLSFLCFRAFSQLLTVHKVLKKKMENSSIAFMLLYTPLFGIGLFQRIEIN